VTTHVRIYPAAGQRQAQTRTLFLAVRSPDDVAKRPVDVVTNLATWHGVATNGDTVTKTISVCLPPRRYTDVRISAPASPPGPGGSRALGVSVRALALADEVGGPCRPRAPGAQ